MMVVFHDGTERTLSLSEDALVLSPADSSSPTTVPLADIAFISSAHPSPSITYLSPPSPEATNALPTVHTLALNLATTSGAPPLFDSPALAPLLLHPSSTHRSLSVILNPSAGARTAQRFFADIVRPLLDAAAIAYDLTETNAAGEAGVIGARLVGQGARTVLLVGGDGTTHEFVNGVLGARADAGASAEPVDIILL